MESNKTLLVGCGINCAFNQAFNQNKNSFLRSNFSYKEILPKMFNETSGACELKLKFKIYLNNHKDDLEEFLRYDFSGADGFLCEEEREEIKKEFIKILGQNHHDLTLRRAIQEDENFLNFQENIKTLNCIYTTNFDLKLYYLMAELKLFGNKNNNYQLFCDSFYGGSKNCIVNDIPTLSFQEQRSKPSSLIYLHGSMHLFSDSGNGDDVPRTLKIVNVDSDNLIKNREIICGDERFHDLFVLGGTTKEKREIIDKNAYLKQALESLKNIEGDLIIYGCSIDDNDAHIWEAVCSNNSVGNIYIGRSNKDRDEVTDRVTKHFKNKHVSFYSQDDNNIWKEVNWVNKITESQSA